MSSSRDSLANSTYHGVIFGLGTSLALGLLFHFEVPKGFGPVGLAGMGMAASMLALRAPRIGRIDAFVPFVFASQLMFGLGPAVVTAHAAALLCRSDRRQPRGAARLQRMAFESGAAAIAAGAGGVAYAVLAGVAGNSPSSLVAVGSPALGWALGFGATRWITRRFSTRDLRCAPVVDLGHGLAAAAVGIPLASVFEQPYGPWILAATLFAALAFRLGAASATRSRRHDECPVESDTVHRSVTRALAGALAVDDPALGDHVKRVDRLCLTLGIRMGLSEGQRRDLGHAALLHEVGRIVLPEAQDSGPRWAAAERKRLRVHPSAAPRVLETLSYPASLLRILRHRTERWDGRGSPEGLCGEEIPAASRILAAADHFDTLRSEGPGGKGLDTAGAIQCMRDESGKRFDPLVVDLLEQWIETPEEIVFPETTQGAGPTESLPTDRAGRRRGDLAVSHRALDVMYEIDHLTGCGMPLGECVDLVLRRLGDLIEFETCAIYAHDPGSGLLHARFTRGVHAERLRGLALAAGSRVSGWSVLNRQALLVDERAGRLATEGFLHDLHGLELDDGPRGAESTLVAPLVTSRQCLGAVALYGARGRRHDSEDRARLITVAGHLARAVESAGAEWTRRPRAALTDPSTGLPNAEFLRLELAQRAAMGTECGVIALRLHGLDGHAEQHGAEAQERLLGRIAGRLAGSVERGDTLARYGPDLFVVLTPAHLPHQLFARLDRISDAVERRGFEAPSGLDRRICVSAAHAISPFDGSTLESLFEVLDQRLTQAPGPRRSVLPFRPASNAG